MKKNKTNFLGIMTIVLSCALLFFVGFSRYSKDTAKEVYKVYLNGEMVGLIEDEKELYNLIDEKQNQIKDKFKVSRVYPPSGLKVTKYITYDEKLSTANEIYNIIEDKGVFTILGYTVSIKADDGSVKKINILNKEDLEPALMDAAKAFIEPERLNGFLNDNQEDIIDTGKIIENLYFDEKITVKESYLPIDSNIITNKADLTKYLLFGTLEKQEIYTVKLGDTVENVAYNNKLSSEELLIANPSLSSVNSLLSAGQKLNIGLIAPQFTIVEESTVVADVEKAFDTVYEEDPNRYSGQTYTKQQGVNGVSRITQKIQYKNGEITNLEVSGTPEIITAPINKIVVKGTKREPSYNPYYSSPAASSTDWGWPTISPYVITSYYGWRWGRLHGGIDISGSGYGSPIYSATDGVVIDTFTSCPSNGYYGSSCGGGFGNYVYVKSTSGLTIIYGHIKNSITVSVGQTVKKGQHIGYLGNSGSSTGPHLHFEIRDENGNKLNPCKAAFVC